MPSELPVISGRSTNADKSFVVHMNQFAHLNGNPATANA